MHICTKIQIRLKVGAYCTNFSIICIKAIEGEVFYRTFGIGEVLKICLCGYPSLDLTSGLVRVRCKEGLSFLAIWLLSIYIGVECRFEGGIGSMTIARRAKASPVAVTINL